MYAAAGAARGVLGDAGVGAGVLALWAKGRVRLRTVPMPGMGHHVPRTHSPAGRTASTWLGFTTARPPVFPPMALHVRNLGPDRAIVTVTIYRAATSARPHARRWCCISSLVLTVSLRQPPLLAAPPRGEFQRGRCTQHGTPGLRAAGSEGPVTLSGCARRAAAGASGERPISQLRNLISADEEGGRGPAHSSGSGQHRPGATWDTKSSPHPWPSPGSSPPLGTHHGAPGSDLGSVSRHQCVLGTLGPL